MSATYQPTDRLWLGDEPPPAEFVDNPAFDPDADVGMLQEGDEVTEDARLLGVVHLLIDQGGQHVAPRPVPDPYRRPTATEIGSATPMA